MYAFFDYSNYINKYVHKGNNSLQALKIFNYKDMLFRKITT